MPALPAIELRPDVFKALQGLAQERHAPSLEAFVEHVLLQAIEEAESDKHFLFLSLAQERLADGQPRLSHDQVLL